MTLIKETAETLEHWLTYHSGADTRETRIAITKLEEAVMWGVKGITG